MADPNRDLRVTRALVVSQGELDWRFSGSGGPGGQHANTANTRVELRFDIASSASLGPRQRARLLERLGPSVRVVASSQRSQLRNREEALDRLAAKLAAALRLEKRRRQTSPAPAAREQRLRDKHARAEQKRARRRPEAEE